MTRRPRVIDFAKRENAAGGPSDPDIPARLLRYNCGTCLGRKKIDIIISVYSMPEYPEYCKSKSSHIVGLP